MPTLSGSPRGELPPELIHLPLRRRGALRLLENPHGERIAHHGPVVVARLRHGSQIYSKINRPFRLLLPDIRYESIRAGMLYNTQRIPPPSTLSRDEIET